MPIPNFKLLKGNPVHHARVTSICDAATSLLETNYLDHFTDHSVNHSNQLCNLVDELASSFEETKRLNPDEASVLYAACYFHDAGMQHKRANQTDVVRTILAREPYQGQSWPSLDIATRQEIVRAHHHYISAELVRDAVRAGDPILGIPLNDNDRPGIISALCLAHCLSTDTAEYQNATADQGGLRVSLLSALLRLADILDESRRRSHLHLERVRELPLISRLHWWRHYYVSDVHVEPRAITVWFDFPPTRRQQYKDLIEPLQMPWIEAEFRRHSNILAANGLAWHLQSRDTPETQCTARIMDDDLERFAIEEHTRKRSEQLHQEREATVKQLRIARPTIEREFATLHGSTDGPDEQLGRALELAEHLAKIGGRRDAWMSLWNVFGRLKAKATELSRLNTALRLAELMIEDSASNVALRHLQEFTPHFSKLPKGDAVKLRFLRVWTVTLRDNCVWQEAIAAFADLLQISNLDSERKTATAEIAEIYLLQGELEQLPIDEEDIC